MRARIVFVRMLCCVVLRCDVLLQGAKKGANLYIAAAEHIPRPPILYPGV